MYPGVLFPVDITVILAPTDGQLKDGLPVECEYVPIGCWTPGNLPTCCCSVPRSDAVAPAAVTGTFAV